MKPTWDAYFLDNIAPAVSTRSSCVRARVGAVVVKDNRIVGSGYNDAPAGMPGCESCPRRDSGVEPGSSYDTGAGSCVAVHAEANALIFTDRADLREATLYITRSSCDGCLKLVRAAGVRRLVWPGGEMALS